MEFQDEIEENMKSQKSTSSVFLNDKFIKTKEEIINTIEEN